MHHTFSDVSIQGYLGKDPKVEDKLIRLSIGYTVKRKSAQGENNDLTKWIDTVMFSTAPGFEWVKSNLRKGDLIHARGSVENTSYDRNGQTTYSISVILNSVSVIPRDSKKS